MGTLIFVLSFPISWTVKLITMLYERVLWGGKAEFEGFINRVKTFGACPVQWGPREEF